MGKTKKHIVVTVIGKDEVGIVAKVATSLAESNINLIDINQKILGDEIFAMTLLALCVTSLESIEEEVQSPDAPAVTEIKQDMDA